MTTLPSELVETIIYDAWHSEMPSSVRMSFMTSCSRVNQMWKAVYAPIASRDIYITNVAYIYYLCDIAQFQKSIIYHDFIPRLTLSITCFVDLRKNAQDRYAKEVSKILMQLPNYVGFKALFRDIRYISCEFIWSGSGQRPHLRVLHGLPIHVICRRYLSESHHAACRARMDVDISITNPDLSSSLYYDNQSEAFTHALNEVDITAYSFSPLLPHTQKIVSDALWFHQTWYKSELPGDLEFINWRLWMASKRPHPGAWVEPPSFDSSNIHWSRIKMAYGPVLSPEIRTAELIFIETIRRF
ncbi:uncharacterized protein BT62DRAFT_934060 [Guyanagaster necrorhizus]|uniref:Uncharacterized protein n=1 Tax=Guyanagaster necrorhizus TaxID=856835 RepID=A0A9P8AR02_9AGAR|nr:uncharacterized protein BT62DRAFT_934060 [Guyanagaster necrorhizus MCA 3950]KAG7444396.1 hypothetical protein BT62DRAFT_934060 [Guyanagaster necrorhizus MCA 3950]